MIEESIEDVADNILYELLIYSEWLQDPDLLAKSAADKNEETNHTGSFKNWLASFTTEPCPPDLIHRLTNLQMPWSFAVGGEGAVIAILQDSHLEIRTSRDEYGAIIGRTQVYKDPYPQWRKLLWSPDCTMLAVAYSSGKIDFYDLIGAYMFSIEAAVSTNVNTNIKLQYSVVGMAFSDVRVKNTQWSYEFLIADYEGTIRGYFISPSDGHKESHVFSLSSCYPTGISAFMYDSMANVLLVCGKSLKLSHLSHSNDASQMGLSIWRIISGYPYYKLALTLDEQMNFSKTSAWNMIFNKIYGGPKQDLIFKMSVSPNGKILAAIHISGALSLWDLPSLRLKKYWGLQLQPNYADVNPRCCEPGMKKKLDFLMLSPFQSHIIDINWWSDEAIIMVRVCGAVTVSSINSLRNLLGISPEWFEPSPAVTSFYNGGFLAVECEVKMKNKKRSLEDNSEDDESSDDDDEPSIFAYSAEMTQKALYFITDSERFRPPKKKMKKISKIYRLLCLKSTTPEELYTRKINNEEYGEALVLAQTYNLDCDLVYQKQWRKMPATVETIHDYLSKITKRSWVLHECIERVPENFEAAKELLLFGLQGTDLKALIAIGKGEDHGRFILCSPYDDIPSDFGSPVGYNFDMEDVEALKKSYQEKKRAELLKQINFKKLTLEQKQLCLCRLKLLSYLDKLTAYEAILGGPLMAYEQYDHKFFKQFRSQCGLEAAIYFASNSNWQAIATLFTYSGAETLPHRLPILSFFPETTNPADYQTLLPLFNEHESIFYTWEEEEIREPDWCEIKFQKNAAVPTAEDDFVESFYEKYDNLIKYRQFPLTSETVTEWYILRSKEIEEKTLLIDNALELIKLGVQRNIQGLEKLLDDLLTLEVMIYECSISDICLQEYEELSAFERIKLMMSTTSDVNFIKNLQQWLFPFLDRYDKYEPSSGKMLLKTYILSISKNDLCYCKKIVEHSCCETSPIISDFNELVSLGLDCIYYCERTDQVKVVKEMYDLITAIPDLRYKCMAKNLQSLLDNLDELQKHISIAEILDRNSLFVTLATVKNISKNEEEVKKLLVKLTRMASHRCPSLDENGWNLLLSDVLEMQQILFKCITFEDCYEIVLQSLLCSGKPENITFAGKMMECNKKQKKREQIFGQFSFKLPYIKSVKLVLAASQEYFNSSASPNDPCMALARACLNLIEDVPTNIEEELDLIASISLLQDFNLNVLPLQVRLCENRINLVQDALQKSNKSYKKSRKIMKLAYLLRAWSKDSEDREGKVLTLIAERAFEVKDYAECFTACKQIMEKGYKDGWLVCNILGSCDDFNNIPGRCDLLSFSVSYCSDDCIENILKARSALQLQVLQGRVKYLIGDDAVRLCEKNSLSLDADSLETDMNGTNALWHTTGKTLQVLQNTTQTTKAVLTSVKSTKFWKDAVNWIQPLGISWKENASDIEENCNKSLNKQGICDFYSGLIENSHTSKLEASYLRYARPDFPQSLELAFCIFRACFLEDFLKNESSKTSVENPVIFDIARAFLSEDLVYSLCVLLTLKEGEAAEPFLSSLPSTPLVLQFGSLYFAIKLMNEIGRANFSVDNDDDLNPLNIINKALDVEKSGIELDVQSRKYYDLLLKYNKMLYDFVQAEILHSIGGGVDATRFTTDDVYKKDTILGISMTLDDEVFRTAVSLAHHYHVSLWDLYITHLEYLFSEPGVPASMISERLEKLNLLKKLLEKKSSFQAHLQNNIYPGIYGQDHDKLNLCFELLESCGDNKDKIGISPSQHMKLLNKFRASMKSINYKSVMNAESSLSYLASIINESNVHIFAKAAENIPKADEVFYEPGNIYCLWLQKYFFEGNSANLKVPSTKTEWIHRYESCSDMLQRLSPGDVLQFIHHVIFSDQALEKMSVDCRAEVVKRCIKFCRTKCTKTKNDIELSSSWNDASTVLSNYFRHLQRMEDETLKQLRDSFDPKIRSYCKDFDISKSDTEKLQSLLVRIVLEGPDLSSLKNFLSCCPENIDWEPADAYLKAIHVILLQMKEPQTDSYTCFKTTVPIHILEEILKDISDKKEELMIEDMAVEILNEFCQDVNVSVSTRLSILQLLEKTNCLSPEYDNLLLLYRTQAIISAVWPDIEISEEEIKDHNERILLFNSLNAKSKSVNQFTSLAKLLNYWPPFPQEQFSDHLDEPFTKVLSGLISLSDDSALKAAVDTLDTALLSPSFNLQCSKEIFERIKEKGNIIHILKTALKTECVELHNAALDSLKIKNEITSEDYDTELLHLILKRNLVAKIISTGLYKPVIEFLLHCQDDSIQEDYTLIDNVIKELHEAGFTSEAGSLLQIKCSTHTGLSTFSSAIHVLHRWISVNKS